MMTHEEAGEKARRMSDTGEYHVNKTVGSIKEKGVLKNFSVCSIYIDGISGIGATFEECFSRIEEK